MYLKYLRKSAENGDREAINEIKTEVFKIPENDENTVITQKQIFNQTYNQIVGLNILRQAVGDDIFENIDY